MPPIPSGGEPTRPVSHATTRRPSQPAATQNNQPTWVKVAAGAGSAMLLGGVGLVMTSFANASEETSTAAEAETPWWSDGDLTIATAVKDDMSFAQAFAAARAEVGAGGAFEWHGNVYSTYYANEWNAMSKAEQHAFNDHFQWNHGKSDPAYDYTAHHSASSAHSSGSHSTAHHPTVDEHGMTFSQAFADARGQVGAGGVFEWNGKLYNTYTREEWNSMTPQDKHEFAQAVSNVHQGQGPVANVGPSSTEQMPEPGEPVAESHGLDNNIAGDPSVPAPAKVEIEPETETDPDPVATADPDPAVIDENDLDHPIAATTIDDPDDAEPYITDTDHYQGPDDMDCDMASDETVASDDTVVDDIMA